MDLQSRIIDQIGIAEDDNKLLIFKSGIGQQFKDLNGFYAVLLNKLSQSQNSVTKMLFETKSINEPISKDEPLVKIMKEIEVKIDEIETDLKDAYIFAKKLNNARQ